MPLYDYECRNCGHRVEVLHGVNDSGPATCELCGGQMRKLINQPAIVFKGSGWAKKDARDSKSTTKSTTKPSADSESSKSDSESSKSSDSESSKPSDSGSASETATDKPAPNGTSTTAASD